MSKIICDICGTAYPETATQCPICSSVRPGGVDAVPAGEENGEGTAQRSYTYVKGGRFSKKNVKKRNRERMASGQYEQPEDDYEGYEEEKNNTGLVIAVIVLALAIVATLFYIGSRFMRNNDPKPGEDTRPVATTEQTEPSTEDTVPQIPCEDIVISKQKLEFDKKGVAYLLNVTTQPKNTTDEIKFVSSDENVVTVTDGGKITAVGSGTALITVTCGEMVTQCEVVCTFEDDTTEPTETEEPDANVELKLNREDFTLTSKGSTWLLYDGELDADKITWTTDNEKVVTIKNGVVTATGKGMTTVYAEYGGTKVSCIVRCADSVGTYTEPTEPEPEQEEIKNYTISHEDVTITVGETFTLTLKNKENEVVNVTWHISDPGICNVSGNDITGATAGVILVTTDYEGEFYECTVRVKEKE